ncbi:pyridoxine/pyridoxamine 5'-phosphate oxidase [Herbidospora yilanensis]|uniref:pyridoxine/pyridoxamine 5'-phosphate oxidase n=1 Tax=Herbidospora yilanensis TaxID=354426 RepID=UPI000A063796|nr:pyridoxal 5'-phosphate synthase [Herbidospora yilanensis]
MAENMRDLLRSLPVFPADLPGFDRIPDEPYPLFVRWMKEAIEAGVLGPHAMTLSTVDLRGRPSSRVLICKDVTSHGHWFFATGRNSRKGQDLEINPNAALTFYWPQVARQVRVSGVVVPAGAEASAADFLARPPASRAEALIGRQSEPLDDPAELGEAFDQALARVTADPGLVEETWTLYELTAHDVEFWQADHQRKHHRVRYSRTGGTWQCTRLWP